MPLWQMVNTALPENFVLGCSLIFRRDNLETENFKDILVILDDEYNMLSEQFEFISADQIDEIPKFILTTKEKNIKRLVRLVFENELNELEKRIVYLHLVQGIPLTRAASSCGVTRIVAITALKNGKNKLYTFLKYPYIMDFSVLNPPESFNPIKEKFVDELTS